MELRGGGGGGGERGPNFAQVFKALVASAVLQYTSTAIVMPWEVGKLLLQVQWVPRDAGEDVDLDDRGDEEGEEEEAEGTHKAGGDDDAVGLIASSCIGRWADMNI